MKLVVSHITGNANVKAAVNGFYKANLLQEFNVSLATFEDNLLGKLARYSVFGELKRRQFKQDIARITRAWPWFEMGRVLMPKLKMPGLIQNINSPFHIDHVCQNFDRHVASGLKRQAEKGADAIYAYEDIAEFSFREAKKQGLQCLYDLPIGYWKAANELMEAEKDRWPEYFETIIGFDQSEAKLLRKENELSMADQIYVASSFTAKTLQYHEGPLAPVVVVPYGFPPVNNTQRTYNFGQRKRKLKLLFVGSLSQRKGIADIFAAVNQLKNSVELTVVGTKAKADCTVVNSELEKHTWIPSLAHDKILELMRAHDVLLFPSLFEGFGLVITEAMSQGTPVITTDRTAGPDIITNGENGWLIEAASTQALVAAIENLLANPHLIGEAGRLAKKTAANRSWEQYGYELATAVQNQKQPATLTAAGNIKMKEELS